MIQNAKQSNAIAYLRQLCCLGLDKEILIPEFLRAVKKVIPSGSNVFAVVNEQFKPSRFILEFVNDELDEETPVIVTNFFSPDCRSSLSDWFGRHPVLSDWPALMNGSFYKSDMYNVVWHRFDQYHGLHAPVKQDNKPVGLLNLFRPYQQKPFDSREQMLFAQLLPYVAHALHGGGGKNIQYSDNGSSGMMLMDTQGRIQYLSQGAKSLLALACHSVLSLDARSQEDALLAKLAQLCRNLQAIFQDKHAAPPSWCHTNGRGRFTFRASWLNRINNEPDRLIIMTIEHQEPLEIKILRALQDLPLTPVQKEVAAMLAKGFSNDQIGQCLHIKLTTVKDHIRKIFTRLDIYRREELLPKLLTMERSNGGVGGIPLVFTSNIRSFH